MRGLTLATCDRALPPAGGAPEWVHILPAGHIVSRDGREFDLPDPAALVLDFQNRGLDLVIDYEHQNDIPAAKLKGPVPAAGWIKELAADETGIWGRVEWTETARNMIARKEYRYLSPSFLHNKSGHVMRLNGAGLVHRPALHLTALASQEDTMHPTKTAFPENSGPEKSGPEKSDPEKSDPAKTGPDGADNEQDEPTRILDMLYKMLGLAPDASMEDVKAALEQLVAQRATAAQLPDPARYVPISAVSDLLADRNIQLATLREGEARAQVDAALAAGHITPAMKDWALELCSADPVSFAAFVAKSPAPYAHITKAARFPTIAMPHAAAPASDAELAICAQLGLAPGALKS